MIGLQHVLVVGALLFSIGLFVALSKRNAVGVLMGIELMLNSVNLNLVGFSRFVQSPRPIDGQVFVRCQFIILDYRLLVFSQAFPNKRTA